VWIKRECRKRTCGQLGDKAIASLAAIGKGSERLAPNLSTLIHPLPTLRRESPLKAGERLRRYNKKEVFLELNDGTEKSLWKSMPSFIVKAAFRPSMTMKILINHKANDLSIN